MVVLLWGTHLVNCIYACSCVDKQFRHVCVAMKSCKVQWAPLILHPIPAEQHRLSQHVRSRTGIVTLRGCVHLWSRTRLALPSPDTRSLSRGPVGKKVSATVHQTNPKDLKSTTLRNIKNHRHTHTSQSGTHALLLSRNFPIKRIIICDEQRCSTIVKQTAPG